MAEYKDTRNLQMQLADAQAIARAYAGVHNETVDRLKVVKRDVASLKAQHDAYPQDETILSAYMESLLAREQLMDELAVITCNQMEANTRYTRLYKQLQAVQNG